MQRQGIQVSLKTLKELVKELEEETKELKETTGLDYPEEHNFQLVIINKTNKSDTWEFE